MCRLQKIQQGGFAVVAGGFVLHIQKVPGVFQANEMAVGNRLRKLMGIAGHGVFVPFAIDKQHRDLDALGGREEALLVAIEHVVYMKVHLRVLMLGQGADMPKVEALEERRQVLAQGVVDQVADLGSIARGQAVAAAFQVVAHGCVDQR